MNTIKPFIHPTAVVSESAKIGHGSWIGPRVRIGDGVTVGAFSVIGSAPEHRSFYDDMELERSMGVEIAPMVKISDFVSIHAGTLFPTFVGYGSAVFQRAHIAHDCYIEERCTIGGQTSLAGHTRVMDGAIVGGKSCTHQFSVLGPLSFLAPMAFLKANIPPAEIWIGTPARPSGINSVGLERAGISYEDFIERAKAVYYKRIKQ